MSHAVDILDGRDLTREATGRRATLWWGVVLLVVIEATVVLSFVSSYFYFRVVRSEIFPPATVSPPSLVLPLVELGLAVASLIPAHLSVRFARGAKPWAMRTALVGGALLMIAYGVVATFESQARDYLWSTHAYGSIVWTLSGYQYFHVATIALLALGFVGFSFLRRLEGPGRAPLQAVLVYWDFVVASSAAVFVTLYLSPRFL